MQSRKHTFFLPVSDERSVISWLPEAEMHWDRSHTESWTVMYQVMERHVCST
jgi:hypothetical protein